MTRTGRPLRFLAIVLGGWVVMRLAAWTVPLGQNPSAAPTATAWRAEAPAPRRGAVTPPVARAAGSATNSPFSVPDRAGRHIVMPAGAPPVTNLPPGLDSGRVLDLVLARDASPAASAQPDGAPAGASLAQLAPSPVAPPASTARRWSLSAWMLWRPDARPSLGAAPLLGGSQAGVRLDFRLMDRASLYVRGSRAFARPFAEEAAVGVAVRPVPALPVSLMAERRQKMGTGGRSDFALMAAGGVGPTALGARAELEGYVQAGIVGLRDPDGFADGRLSLAYRLTAKRKADFAIGLSAWGSAQPGAERVDIGPELRLRLPAGGGRFRLSAEWRERIAGRALPASGPAVTLIAEF